MHIGGGGGWERGVELSEKKNSALLTIKPWKKQNYENLDVF